MQQLEFLENRKKQYLKAALQAKQKNDVEQAKVLLRTAKGFEPMIEAARSGKPVDISKVSTRRIYSDPTGSNRGSKVETAAGNRSEQQTVHIGIS